MPIYEYECTNCDHNFDELQKMRSWREAALQLEQENAQASFSSKF